MIDAHIQLRANDHFLSSLRSTLELSGSSGVIALQGEQGPTERQKCIDTVKASDDLIHGLVAQLPWTADSKMRVQLESDEREKAIVGYLADTREVEIKSWLNDEDLSYGLQLISDKSKPLDLLTTTAQIPHLLPLIDTHADLHIVLDHCGGSAVAPSDQWQRFIREIGRRPHVYYRLSGLATGLSGNSAYELTDSVKSCFETALEAFGSDRILYGSGWPELEATYPVWLNTVDNLVNNLSEDETDAIYGNNAMAVYGVS